MRCRRRRSHTSQANESERAPGNAFPEHKVEILSVSFFLILLLLLLLLLWGEPARHVTDGFLFCVCVFRYFFVCYWTVRKCIVVVRLIGE